jgi:hypothetical protein
MSDGPTEMHFLRRQKTNCKYCCYIAINVAPSTENVYFDVTDCCYNKKLYEPKASTLPEDSLLWIIPSNNLSQFFITYSPTSRLAEYFCSFPQPLQKNAWAVPQTRP